MKKGQTNEEEALWAETELGAGCVETANPGVSPTRNVSPLKRRAALSLHAGALRPRWVPTDTVSSRGLDSGQRLGCRDRRELEVCQPPAGSPESTCSSLHPPIPTLSATPGPRTTLGPGAALGPGSHVNRPKEPRCGLVLLQ